MGGDGGEVEKGWGGGVGEGEDEEEYGRED